MQSLKQRIQAKVLAELDMSVSMTDQELCEILDACIWQETKGIDISQKERIEIRKFIFNQIRGFDVLSELLEDEDISEIMINGYENIFIEKNGRIQRVHKSFSSEERLKSVIQQIVANCNRRVNESEPIVDARLADGARVNIVMKPVALDGSMVTIRKFQNRLINLDELIKKQAISEEVAEFLKALIKAKYNIFISGGTGAGKTTLLNALSQYIPSEERVITIEDSAELKLQGVENIVRLEMRNANVEGENQITIRDLIKTSLRMRPDRIIVGEVRDAAAIDMLQAMNTGHDGSLSTGHANSCRDMLARLETMVLMGMEIPLAAIRQQIASAIDIVVHLGRLRDKSRRVLEICEVLGVKEGEIKLNTLYEFVEQGTEHGRIKGQLRKVNDLINLQKMMKTNGATVVKEEEMHECVSPG